MMKLQTTHRGSFLAIRLLGEVTLNTETGPLVQAVEQALAAGRTSVAITFGENSFLYTRHIASLIRCLELIREQDGSLAVINPNQDIRDVLALIDPEGMIVRADSEEALEQTTRSS